MKSACLFQVEDINLNVGSGTELGESIIQNFKGASFVIQRTLRDLLHQIPSIEVIIMVLCSKLKHLLLGDCLYHAAIYEISFNLRI